MKMSYEASDSLAGSNLTSSLRASTNEPGSTTSTTVGHLSNQANRHRPSRELTWLELKPLTRDLQELTNTIESCTSNNQFPSLTHVDCGSTSSSPSSSNQNCPSCLQGEEASCCRPYQSAQAILGQKAAYQLARQAIFNKQSAGRGIKRPGEQREAPSKLLAQQELDSSIEAPTEASNIKHQPQQQQPINKLSTNQQTLAELQVVSLSCNANQTQHKITEDRKVQISSTSSAETELKVAEPRSSVVADDEKVQSKVVATTQVEPTEQVQEEEESSEEEESDFNYEPVLSQILNEKKLALSASPEVTRFFGKLQQKITKQRQ